MSQSVELRPVADGVIVRGFRRTIEGGGEGEGEVKRGRAWALGVVDGKAGGCQKALAETLHHCHQAHATINGLSRRCLAVWPSGSPSGSSSDAGSRVGSRNRRRCGLAKLLAPSRPGLGRPCQRAASLHIPAEPRRPTRLSTQLDPRAVPGPGAWRPDRVPGWVSHRSVSPLPGRRRLEIQRSRQVAGANVHDR